MRWLALLFALLILSLVVSDSVQPSQTAADTLTGEVVLAGGVVVDPWGSDFVYCGTGEVTLDGGVAVHLQATLT
jgi:hypothetical protein